MNCPDCKDVKLVEDSFDPNKARDTFEIVWKCPKCHETFFATIYREEKTTTSRINSAMTKENL